MDHVKKIIPKRLQIETIFGCNAKCIMCPINIPTERKKGLMPLEMTKYILDEMSPYTRTLEKLDFFFLGEPLLDPYIFERIQYAKMKGFRSVAISTNADLLNDDKQVKLLESGVDTVIFSIDGANKETHEKIRLGVNFERVIRNCENIIKKRDSGDYTTRFVVRFIRQDANRDEWAHYKKYWLPKLSKEKNDLLIYYDMNFYGDDSKYSKKELIGLTDDAMEKRACHMLFDRLIILNDGSVPLCCLDMTQPVYCFGNVKDTTPIDIYNSAKFNEIRKIHLDGKKNTLQICKECTILYNEKSQIIEYPYSKIKAGRKYSGLLEKRI